MQPARCSGKEEARPARGKKKRGGRRMRRWGGRKTRKMMVLPWPVWLSWSDILWQGGRLWVQFLIRTDPSFCPSVSSSLPSHAVNKYFFFNDGANDEEKSILAQFFSSYIKYVNPLHTTHCYERKIDWNVRLCNICFYTIQGHFRIVILFSDNI